MAGHRERYWPSLWDRLTMADARGVNDAYVDTRTLRQQVRRDLKLLLNTTALEAHSDLSRFPRVRRSVLNFGIVDLPGRIVSGISEWELREQVGEALRHFEPRIAPESVTVHVDTEYPSGNADEAVRIDPERGVMLSISGKVHGTPAEHLRIRTRLDIATGYAEVDID